MEQKGLLHLYYGVAKARLRLPWAWRFVRWAADVRVVIVQFLKGGFSGEVPGLEKLGAVFYRGVPGEKFVFQMSEEERTAARAQQNANLTADLAQPADLLVLDEAGSAMGIGYGGQRAAPAGSAAAPGWPGVCTYSAYAAAMDAGRSRLCYGDALVSGHPYQKGIAARQGIEY